MEKNNGVYLVLSRHGDTAGTNLSAKGAVEEYFVGKHLSEVAKIPPVEHFFYSPISRTRNTMRMQTIAMQVNLLQNPGAFYDIRLHEGSGISKEALDTAIILANECNMQCIEIVSHQPIISDLCKKLHQDAPSGYGGLVVLKADNWYDMLVGNNIQTVYTCNSAEKFLIDAFGEENTKYIEAIISKKPSPETIPNGLEGKDFEVLEAWDVYKYWANTQATAIGLTNIFHSCLGDALIGTFPPHTDNALDHSYINARSFGEKYYADPSLTYPDDPHAVFNAFAQKLEKQNGNKTTVRKLEVENTANILDEVFPGYREAMHAGETHNEYPDSNGDIRKGHEYTIISGEEGFDAKGEFQEKSPILTAGLLNILRSKELKD